MTELCLYEGQRALAVDLIKAFWLCHNNWEQSTEEALQDLVAWTAAGHRFYFICQEGQTVGFVHLGSRGAACDWLEDLFVLPQFQRRGIGTKAAALAEEIVKEYSGSLYMEAAARNGGAIRLYRKLGYDCLNTVTLRKDFQPENFDCVRKERIQGQEFEVRKSK